MSLISLPGNSNIKVPGVYQDPNPHITLIYLGDNLDALDLIKVINVVEKVCNTFSPFLVKVNYSTVFAKGEKGYPVICPIDSAAIYSLRDKIINEFYKNRIEFVNNYTAFRPHQTITFSKKVIPSYPLNVSWNIDKVNIWPENKGSRGEIQIPLRNKFNLNKLSSSTNSSILVPRI